MLIVDILNGWHIGETKGQFLRAFLRCVNLALFFACISLSLFCYVLYYHCGAFRGVEDVLLTSQWVVLVCIAICCDIAIVLTFAFKDIYLIFLLFVAFAANSPTADAVVILIGVTLGKWAACLLSARGDNGSMERNESKRRIFVSGLVGLLAFASWWHLEPIGNYHGPRWMGLWDNPNTYGMLMGAGLILAFGLVAEDTRLICASKWRWLWILPAGMMGAGLLFSYSRGAWLGTAIGASFFAKSRGKLKWQFIVVGICLAAVILCFFWHSTSNKDAWYLRRLDLSQASAQHRISAWRGAFQIMRDHPFGVGWNKAFGVYQKNYFPPENGAAAITTNSYLMLGTELGLPGLLAFVLYVGFSMKNFQQMYGLSRVGGPIPPVNITRTCTLISACCAAAMMLLVGMWFDGGLFTLPTASMFWILLELGAGKPRWCRVVASVPLISK